MMALARGGSGWRSTNWGPGCEVAKIVAVPWIITSGKIQCHKDAVEAFRALGRVMRLNNYGIRRDVTGCYNCRAITGGTAPSAHAQGIALDVNWDTNPYVTPPRKMTTDMPRDMVEACLGLATTDGVPLFRWGGDWDNRPETPHSNYDAMHWEIIATPEELRRKVLTLDFDPANQRAWPLLAVGARGPAVVRLQTMLNEQGDTHVDDDGLFGNLTMVAVSAYQASRKLPADAIVGLGTWTSLFTKAPALADTDISPHKGQMVA